MVDASTVARSRWNPLDILTGPQLAAFQDVSILRVVDGGRRIGKSKLAAVMLLDTALRLPRARCLFLALTREDARDIVWQELIELNQDYALGGEPNLVRLEMTFPNGSRVTVGGAKDRQQAERRRGRFYRLVIIDECFPAGTLIDGRPIETLKAGDEITAVDHITGTIVRRRVVGTTRKTVAELVKLSLSDGTVVDSTPNHPFFVRGKGYVNAGQVVAGDMCCVRRSEQPVRGAAPHLRADLCGQEGTRVHRRGARASSRGNGEEQPNAQPGREAEGVPRAEGNGALPPDSRRERARADACGDDSVGSTGLADERDRQNDAPPRRVGLPELLQVGSGGQIDDDLYRGRWSEPLLTEETGAGREENSVLEWVGVESVSRIEPRGSDGFAVYNLEVEGAHTYFANDVLVHNCQTFPSHLFELVEAILKPSLLGKGGSKRRGKIVLMGTPSEVPGVGYWETCVNSSLWSKHSWTIYDNTHLGTRDEIDKFLAEMAESMGGADEPRYQREFLGRRVPPKNMDRPYIYDVTRQDFRSDIIEQSEDKQRRFTRWALPAGGEWRYVFGIDLGHTDASALIVWGCTDAVPGVVWLVEEFVSTKMLPDALWAKVTERRAVYRPLEMAVDEGGLGKMIAEQWRAPPYSLPVVPADKFAIEVQADFLSGAMARGAVRIAKESTMAQDMAVARWDPKKLALGKRVEAHDPHSDVIPAGRYAFKKAHAIATSLRLPAVPLTVAQVEDENLRRERVEGATRALRMMQGESGGPTGRAALGRWGR